MYICVYLRLRNGGEPSEPVVTLCHSQDSMTSLMSRRSKSLWSQATFCTCRNIGGIRWHKASSWAIVGHAGPAAVVFGSNCGGFSMVLFLETEKSVMV